MILEVALLNVRQGEGGEFKAAFERDSSIISSMLAYVSHELQRCIEARDRYVLLGR